MSNEAHRNDWVVGRTGRRTLREAIPSWLPRGYELPDAQWQLRHKGLTALLWGHVFLVPVVGIANGHGLLHPWLEGSILFALAAVASLQQRTRSVPMVATTLGLITASALLVHFSGGLIEMHFHFFIMIAAVTLYQSWIPFLVAVAYVVAHHGIIGTLYPEDVFNHPAAIAEPWKWALIHGLFVAGASAIGLVTWRFNERSQQAATEERFQQLVEALPATFYNAGIGATGTWTYVSPQIEALLGVPPDEWLSDPSLWYESIHPDDRDRVLDHEREVVEHGTPHTVEYRLRRRDGSTAWVRDEATLVRDESGVPRHLQGFMLDITARKEAEEQAARTKAHRDAIVSAALDAIVVADLSGTILEFNPAAEEIFGYRREEVIGRELADTIVPPEFRDAHRAGLLRYVETSASTILGQRVELQGMRSDGSLFPIELSITHDRLGGNDVLVGFMRDITTRKQADEELAGRADRASALVELGQMALSGMEVAGLLDEGVKLVGDVLQVDLCQVFDILPNGRLRLHSGYGWPEEVVGERTLDEGPASQAGYTLATADAVVVDDFENETRFIASPTLLGKPVASGMTVPIMRSGDQLFGVLGAHTYMRRTFTSEDVNLLRAVGNVFSTAIQRKEADDARAALEDQLAQSQKMEAIGALAGGVAHDFNNLLAVIKGYAAFLEDDLASDDPKHDDVGEILSAAEKGTTLVRQLLTFSRKGQVTPEILDVDTIVTGISRMVQRTLSESVQLEVQPSPESLYVEIDRGHLEQILMNLIVNARDAMPRGGVLSLQTSEVIVDERTSETWGVNEGAFISIAVNDTGVGIPADIQSRIFDPFFTTKEKRGGTGLGLATVYGIVKRAGGYISVESEDGVGTTFRVYLPRAERIELAPSSATEGGAPLHGDETILVVEDEEAICRLVERVLSERGYRVISTTSPREALRTAESHEDINLLITDVVMPELSGKELSDALNSRCRIKTLYMSGYADEILTQHGTDKDAIYLQKPFLPEQLLQMVRHALDAA